MLWCTTRLRHQKPTKYVTVSYFTEGRGLPTIAGIRSLEASEAWKPELRNPGSGEKTLTDLKKAEYHSRSARSRFLVVAAFAGALGFGGGLAQGQENASNPLAAVSSTDPRLQYFDWENDLIPATFEIQLGRMMTPAFGLYFDALFGIGSDRPYDWGLGVGLRFSY